MHDADGVFPSPPSLTWVSHTTLLNYASSRGQDAISGKKSFCVAVYLHKFYGWYLATCHELVDCSEYH